MKKWTMPAWMKPYAPCICNTGGNDIAEMMNGNADPRVNLPLSTLQCAVKSQVAMLEQLREAGFLPAPDVARVLVTLRRQRHAISEIAGSIDLVLTSRAFPAKLRLGMAALAETARRGLGA